MLKRLLLLLLCLWISATVSAQPQTPADIERRLADLEAKIKLLDATFDAGGAQDPGTRLERLERKLDELLANRPNAPQPAPPSDIPTAVLTASQSAASSSNNAYQGAPLVPSSATGVVTSSRRAAEGIDRPVLSGYMDFHVNKDSGDSFRPDFHRFVLLAGYSFSDRVKFWGELELEHSLVEGGEETGEFALEQGYLDFLIKPWFNVRAGMLLTPVGIVNERHEPPTFNGVERPFVETVIIPSTWHEMGAGITGDVGYGFRYRAYMLSSLDAGFFDAETGIGGGKTGGFDASMRNPAKVGRLEYLGVRRMALGASFYSGHAGYATPGVNPRVSIAEFDGRYSFRRFDVRGLYAHTWLSRAGELNSLIEQDLGFNPNIARQMRGFYIEPGFHVFRRELQDLIVFTRFESYNTQHRMPRDYVPLPQFDRTSWVTGITYKPVPDVAVKFDYVVNRSASSVVNPLNGVNVGLGWWF